jgi:hypothetical protein
VYIITNVAAGHISTNVALGHIIQPGGPQMGDLCLIFAGKAFVYGIKFKLSIDSPPDFRVVTFTLFMYEGSSISKLQIQVATYVFELTAGKLSPLDSSHI